MFNFNKLKIIALLFSIITPCTLIYRNKVSFYSTKSILINYYTNYLLSLFLYEYKLADLYYMIAT